MFAVAPETPTVAFDRLLNLTLPYHPVWDVVRYVIACYLCLLMVFYMRVSFRAVAFRPVGLTDARAVALGGLTNLTLILPAICQNLTRVGKPVLIWLLPMYAMTCVVGTLHLRARL